MRTALTDLLGIRLPILAGGLHWLSNADYVAAAARAGIMGFITAASFPEIDDLRQEIRKCRDLCQGAPFGVNVSMLPKLVQGEKTQHVFDLICEEGVGVVETSGRNPEAYLPALKAAGVKVIHKVPAVRFAVKAQSIGVDAVSIVGAECGGHPGLDLIGTFVQARMAKDALTIPVVIGGGVGTGEQLVAALAMGAAGVVIGTRFLVAEEIWAHRGFKERLVAASERDTDLILSSLRNTMRVLRNDTSEAVKAIEDAGNGSLETLLPLVSGKVGRQAYVTGDCSQGALSVGQSAIFVDAIEPLAAIVGRLESQARDAIKRVSALS
jgi:nitronate monooxygenase